LTRRRAEALTGYEIRYAAIGHPPRRFTCAAYDGERLVAEQTHADLGMALAALVKAIYRRNGEQVMERHGWRCARCGRTSGLQIHHRRFRSHGGTHRMENLEPLCWPCHGGIHKHERSK
jgi:5-methylcytosine-specific restriction endonuclease McrA